MWLINTATFELQFFVNPPLQPESKAGNYAILSHTWNDDEVVFRDMADLSHARLKKGWGKIEQTCRLARESFLPWAWVDTCCIDKSSSAELSEAINSMFSWYELSKVCYVWLADLVLPLPTAQMRGFEDPFAQCRWFTRGWTLQELIAPRHVVFYARDWTRIGSKTSLESALSSITGIDAEVLRVPGSRFDVPVGKRMSWVASRNTTREEDIAYCLLGIFGVSMPLLYGEGIKAFTRLQEEIMILESKDLSIFAWRVEAVDNIYSHGMLAVSPDMFRVCRNIRRGGLHTNAEIVVTGNGLEIRDPAYKEGVGNDEHSIELDLNLLDRSEEIQHHWLWVTVRLTRGTRPQFYRTTPRALEHCSIRRWLYNTYKPTSTTLPLLKGNAHREALHLRKPRSIWSSDTLEFDETLEPLLYLPPDTRLTFPTDLRLFGCHFGLPVKFSMAPGSSMSVGFRPFAIRISPSPEPTHIIVVHGYFNADNHMSGYFKISRWLTRLILVSPKETANYHLAMTSIMNSGANLWSPEVKEAIYAVGRDYMTQHWTDTSGSVIDVDRDRTTSTLDIEDALDRTIIHRITACSAYTDSLGSTKIRLSYHRMVSMD